MRKFNEFLNEGLTQVNINVIEATLDGMNLKAMISLTKQLSKRITKKYKGVLVQTDNMVQRGQIKEIIIDRMTIYDQGNINADSRIIVDTGEVIRHTFFLMI